MNNVNSKAKKGMLNPMIIAPSILIGIILIAAFTSGAITNAFLPNVESFTPKTEDCNPDMYVVEMRGTLDVINDFLGFSKGYEIHYIDANIADISIKNLGVLSNDFASSICIQDMDGKEIDCKEIKGSVTKGQIEKYPFKFTYNLPDNNCDGQVDDHTFNLVAKVQTEEGFERHEKTVAIVGGKAVFQNVKY